MPAVSDFVFRLPPGPVAYVNFAAVFLGSIEPPFHDLQLEHFALRVVVLPLIFVPGCTLIETFEV